ncbi:MAG: nucleotidyltransferase [Casimicrobiaceae bacterium]
MATDREQIAQAAAALIIEQELDDWQLARRKAARQLGFDERATMPDRVELETALRAYAQLFLAEEQAELVSELRSEALQWMDELAEFGPELTGPVAEGWGYPGCEIRLELLADDAKLVEIALLNRNIEFTPGAPVRPGSRTPEILAIEGGIGPIKLVIQDVAIRRNRKHDRTRMRAGELRTLIG